MNHADPPPPLVPLPLSGGFFPKDDVLITFKCISCDKNWKEIVFGPLCGGARGAAGHAEVAQGGGKVRLEATSVRVYIYPIRPSHFTQILLRRMQCDAEAFHWL